MSKLAQILTPSLTGERKYILPSFKINWEESKAPDIRYSANSTEYNLQALIKVSYFVADFFRTDMEAVHKRMKGQLIEEVFGEFRTNFIELEAAVYEGDLGQIRNALDRFYYKMFKEGL
jgi:hypothetical protein